MLLVEHVSRYFSFDVDFKQTIKSYYSFLKGRKQSSSIDRELFQGPVNFFNKLHIRNDKFRPFNNKGWYEL